MYSGDVRSITCSIAVVIKEICCDPVRVRGNISRSFELSTMCKANSALIQSVFLIKAVSRFVFFATFCARGGQRIR